MGRGGGRPTRPPNPLTQMPGPNEPPTIPADRNLQPPPPALQGSGSGSAGDAAPTPSWDLSGCRDRRACNRLRAAPGVPPARDWGVVCVRHLVRSPCGGRRVWTRFWQARVRGLCTMGKVRTPCPGVGPWLGDGGRGTSTDWSHYMGYAERIGASLPEFLVGIAILVLAV
ncbi:hypothetical protein ISCGN_028725 [Ixodes scapularis]